MILPVWIHENGLLYEGKIRWKNQMKQGMSWQQEEKLAFEAF